MIALAVDVLLPIAIDHQFDVFALQLACQSIK
jgi:hypothetical protein